MALRALNLPFREQAEFLRRKLNMTTEAWTDVYAAEHDYAFMVAGANRNDLVADFRQAVERAINDGETLEQFRSRFDDIVARHGWSYNGGRNWRSRVIYETNLNTTYMAGRYEQLMEVRERRPYWQYIHSGSENPRLQHQAWDGMILRWDDPWWRTNMPTNGWGCGCRVRALGERDLQRMGRDGPDEAPALNWEEREIGQRSPGGPRTVRVPEGVDPGFEYQPGRSRLNGFMPPHGGGGGGRPSPGGGPLETMPEPRTLNTQSLLPTDRDTAFYAGEFLRRFNAEDRPQIVRDRGGDHLVIGSHLLRDRDSQSMTQPLPQRPELTGALAETVRAPDEIWTRLEWFSDIDKAVVRRRFVSRYILPGASEPVPVWFDWGSNGWEAGAGDDLMRSRVGERVYERRIG